MSKYKIVLEVTPTTGSLSQPGLIKLYKVYKWRWFGWYYETLFASKERAEAYVESHKVAESSSGKTWYY